MRKLLLVLLATQLWAATPPPASFVGEMERAVKENLVPFWYPRSLDRTNGGYLINFKMDGSPNGRTNKMIVTQARNVWLFSRLARSGYAPKKEMLEAADLGYRFLRERMWDKKNGGFYWETDATGTKVLNPVKHLYGQSFALYGLSEYAIASGRKDVLEFATRVFDLMEAKAHDREFGGYLETFNADWTPYKDTKGAPMGDPSFKLMNTHLHLMEAVSTFYRASKSPTARERLVELVDIQSNAVVRKPLTACTDKYDRKWTPLLQGEFSRVSYGHDIENVWLLMDAKDALGGSSWPLMDLFRDLFAYSLKYGYDEQGGFFDSGPFNQPADRRTKVWWVEAEAMVSALRMYRMTGESKYLDVFNKTWAWNRDHQIDWKQGEWFASVSPDGKVSGEKGQAWKAGYHNGRALLECLEILKNWK
jgi:mannobiose 2-epimerase